MATFTAGQVLTAAQMNQIGDDSGWIAISSFSNGWSAGSTAPAYRKVGTRVQLRGRLTAGSAGVAFTLPSDYWPSTTQSLVTCNSSTNTPNQISIGTSGGLTPNATVTTSLDNITFFTD